MKSQPSWRAANSWFHMASMSVTVVLLLSGASAQDQPGRALDIKTTLQRISGPDPVDRVVAVQDALGSEDPVLRSLVLEKSLGSDDRRVRAAGFTYLVSVQKRLVAEVAIPQKAIDDAKEARSPVTLVLQRGTTQEITISEYNKSTNQFKGRSNSLGPITGAVGQDGVTIIYSTNGCKLQLPSASGGYLIGSFTCGSSSFVAKVALP